MKSEQRVSTKETEYKEVKTVRRDDEANKLLQSGWILLNAGVSHTDMGGYQAKCHFILGKKAGATFNGIKAMKEEEVAP